MLKRVILPLILMVSFLSMKAQDLPIHVSDKNIYSFIDELALNRIILVNDAIKPYSSSSIYEWLLKAKEDKNKLSKRQVKELERHLSYFELVNRKSPLNTKTAILKKWFNNYIPALDPPGFFYKDSLSYLSLHPIWGIDYFAKQGDLIFHRWGGGSIRGRIGDNFSFQASLRDNTESQIISKRPYLTPRTGANYKSKEYSEMRGGLTYRWNWGSVSMVKDHLSWGSGYNEANIFSQKAPSFAQLKLDIKPVKWFQFNYFHGWLVSNVIDSTHSYWTDNGLRRDVMHNKYVAANMFTFMPVDHIHFSLGNSVIYSRTSPHPAYLIPFFFYKSVDHWLNSTDKAGTYVGQNSQMFFNLSIYRLKGFHFYGSLFVDEFKMARIRDPEVHNFWSYKVGVKHLAPYLKDLTLSLEYTRTNPNTFQHNISTTTFESNEYHLGHYLRDNADEWYVSMTYKPIDKLDLALSYIMARKGPEYGYIKGGNAIQYEFMEEVRWQDQQFRMVLNYEILYNTFIHAGYHYNKSEGVDLELYSPEFFQGDTHAILFGLRIGI